MTKKTREALFRCRRLDGVVVSASVHYMTLHSRTTLEYAPPRRDLNIINIIKCNESRLVALYPSIYLSRSFRLSKQAGSHLIFFRSRFILQPSLLLFSTSDHFSNLISSTNIKTTSVQHSSFSASFHQQHADIHLTFISKPLSPLLLPPSSA